MTGMPMTPYMYRMPRRASVRATTMYPLPSTSSTGAPASPELLHLRHYCSSHAGCSAHVHAGDA